MNRLGSILLDCAKDEGFVLVGLVDIEPILHDDNNLFKAHLKRYDDWLAAGHVGTMEYLVRGRDRRADPRKVLPSAKSMLVVAGAYDARIAGATTSVIGPRYARYLRGPDYHLHMRGCLENLMGRANKAWLGLGNEQLSWKVCVDTSAVLERTWAAMSGLGWIGKNTMLIHPKQGSYTLIGEVLIGHEVENQAKQLPNYCGNCTRCIDACPTKALFAPHELDTTKCISYWTLEKGGEACPPKEISGVSGVWVAGCDICQEVCPFNFKLHRRAAPAVTADTALLSTWDELISETVEQYRARVHASSLSRIKPAHFRRNLEIALENKKTPWELGTPRGWA